MALSEKERKRGCSSKALTPGAAAGGCAFDGAKIALQPITDAAPLVHGPIAKTPLSANDSGASTSEDARLREMVSYLDHLVGKLRRVNRLPRAKGAPQT